MFYTYTSTRHTVIRHTTVSLDNAVASALVVMFVLLFLTSPRLIHIVLVILYRANYFIVHCLFFWVLVNRPYKSATKKRLKQRCVLTAVVNACIHRCALLKYTSSSSARALNNPE